MTDTTTDVHCGTCQDGIECIACLACEDCCTCTNDLFDALMEEGEW